MRTWFKRHVIKILVVLLAVDLVAFVNLDKTIRKRDYIMAKADAYCAGPHPEVVPYAAGMTLCPGQSAVFRVVIERHAGDDI